MCIHEWEQQVQDIQEENNRLVNGDEESAINNKNDFVNDTQELINLTSDITEVITNGHRKLCRTTSDFLMSETSDECDDTLDKTLPTTFCERYSKFVESMADLDEVKFQDVAEPGPVVKKPIKNRPPLGAKPPIAPKPKLIRTQSDGKFINPNQKVPLRPRSGTADSEPPLGDDEDQHSSEDNINKNVITGFSKTKPVIKHVKPPMPAPRLSVLNVKPDAVDSSQTPPPQETVSTIAKSDENRNKEPEVEINRNEMEIMNSNETEEVQTNGNEDDKVEEEDDTPGQRRYGVIEPIDHKEPTNHNELITPPTPAPRKNSVSSILETTIEPIQDEPVNHKELSVPTPAPRLSSGSSVSDLGSRSSDLGSRSSDQGSSDQGSRSSNLGSRYSVNLEEIVCASPRHSNDLDDKAESYGRYSLDLDNLQNVDTESSEGKY